MHYMQENIMCDSIRIKEINLRPNSVRGVSAHVGVYQAASIHDGEELLNPIGTGPLRITWIPGGGV